MHTRAERRETKNNKWQSRLRKLWESNFFMERHRQVKSDNSIKYSDLPKAESYKDWETDKFGVLLKNTGTPLKPLKNMGIKEEHKRNINNKKLTKENIEEIDMYIEQLENPFAFEKYCGSCDYFNNAEECPLYNKVSDVTEWKKIKCDKFMD